VGLWTEDVGPTGTSALAVSRFAAAPDRSVHRWSFSAITAGAASGSVDPYDDTGADAGAADEGNDGADVPGGTDDPTGAPADSGALGALRAGTEFGTFVHAVLERVDFRAGDLDAEVAAAVAAEFARSGADADLLGPGAAGGTGLLIAGLRDAVRTPLGPLFGDSRLADLDRADRLDELAFDMRVGGGDRLPSIVDLGRLLLAHLPDDDPVRPWAVAVADGAIDVRLAGYLTGSIDLVARLAPDGRESFVIADYKTNRLTPRGADPGPADYDARRMADAMAEHHYPLQALLYGVALHRYLRSRRRAGAPPAVVTGAAYLFVRGMTGPQRPGGTGTPHGVFSWAFPEGLLEDASVLLDGRSVGAAR
jgi:exodeoxyribonuclease V beta subunit